MTKRECKTLVEFVLAVHRQAGGPVLSTDLCALVDIACKLQRINEKATKFTLTDREVRTKVEALAQAGAIASELRARLVVNLWSRVPIGLRFGRDRVVNVPCF